MTCIVCYSDLEKKYHCSDIKCKEFYCKECVESLLDFCISEKILPKCPARNCNSFLTLTNFKDINVQNYYQLCLDFFLKDQGDIIEKQLQDKELLKEHCKSRQKFIQDEFPIGISLMAEIAFKSKLKRLTKQKAEMLKTYEKHRFCMNSTCSGFLIDMICNRCQTEFCKKCEKILEKKHECKQEDLDSVHFVNGLIRCPTCQLPVFKNQGCDSISCSYCNTNFLYSTGEIGGHGSSNAKINVNLEQRYKLSVIYKDKIPHDCLKSLLQLELLEPKVINKDAMLHPVKKYIETKDEKMAKSLSIKIDQYHQNRFKIRDYQTMMVKLEQKIKSDKLKLELLNNYIEQFS